MNCRIAMRWFLVAAAVFLASAASARPAKHIEVVYLGADDCFYCQHWEAARKPELLEALRGRNARLIEVKSESLAQPIVARLYPPDLRWLHREVGDLRGVPRFFLVVDGHVDMKVIGTNAYSQRFFPRLQRVLAQGR